MPFARQIGTGYAFRHILVSPSLAVLRLSLQCVTLKRTLRDANFKGLLEKWIRRLGSVGERMYLKSEERRVLSLGVTFVFGVNIFGERHGESIERIVAFPISSLKL